MNINEAKEEVKRAVKAYLEKDEAGQYEIPLERQRPILLMGPPGIGKTAIMEQIAHELGINLVSYTITHHTRQSAIGLPMISQREFGGRKYSVTEYTMSEIIGSIYEQVERSGIKEGILFLDEINCVSETLAPTMLQFLQYKTFGSHRVPDGFVIVTAGNPPQYNKSVRDFDIVTLDRVRQIVIDEDFEAWKDYAYKAGIHGAIMAYLEIKKDNFYSIKTDVDGRTFVTARGWEDLSRVMKVHEKLSLDIDEKLTVQYLQNPEVARDFADYYELYTRYRQIYRIPDILNGEIPDNTDSIRKGSFDEKLSIIGLLCDALMQEFTDYARQQSVQKILFETIRGLAPGGKEKQTGDVAVAGSAAFDTDTESDCGTTLVSALEEKSKLLEKDLSEKKEAGLLDREEERSLKLAALALTGCAGFVKEGLIDEKSASGNNMESGYEKEFALAKKWFAEREDKRQKAMKLTGEHLTNSFSFMEETFGDKQSLTGSQEMVIFITELSSAYHSLKFVRETGNEAYYKYNKLLLLGDRKQELMEMVKELIL